MVINQKRQSAMKKKRPRIPVKKTDTEVKWHRPEFHGMEKDLNPGKLMKTRPIIFSGPEADKKAEDALSTWSKYAIFLGHTIRKGFLHGQKFIELCWHYRSSKDYHAWKDAGKPKR
jgi:hypothetical protein